ncbi:MAG: class I mannose-6-phosphate isomerase [Bacteroidales bacterium]|nr:class I mannose-6-phosphate isomerase [Bacteroidales bacterium]
MYKFTPILKTLVWGTESWVLSGVPGDESVVAEGPEAGKKITDIYPGLFPLLIKFIDTKQDLSVQVHPDDKLAMARYGLNGKTEMWYVIDAAPGASLMSGLKEQITPDDYVRLVEEDRITDVLARHAVSPGDVFFLPAGRIHAIGGGCFLAEIQQTSDLTYRIYDYGRLGLDGKPRQLHTQEAKDAIDYRVYPEYRTKYRMQRDAAVELVRCPYFTTELFELTREMTIPGPAGDDKGFLIVIGVSGQVRLRTAQDETVLSPGEAVLVPAADGALSVLPLPGDGGDGSARFLTTHL